MIETLKKEVVNNQNLSMFEQQDVVKFSDLESNNDMSVLKEGLITKNVFSDKEAIQRKMEMLNTKIFGLFSPVHYSLLRKKKVFIPFELLVFNYRIEKSRNLKVNSLRVREGEIGVIYDLNEEHAFHYDLFDKLELGNKSFEN